MEKIRSKDHILLINFTRIDEIIGLLAEIRSDFSTKDKKICLIDENLEELPEKLLLAGVEFVRGNPTDEDILHQANICEASHVIILAKDKNDKHSDDQNLATTLVAEKLHPEVFSIVEIIDPKKVRQLELAGADSVVCVSELSTNLIIQELQDPGVKKIIYELTTNTFGHQLNIDPIALLGERTFKDLILWGLENDTRVVGIMRNDQVLFQLPKDGTLNKDDKVITIGEKRCREICV